VSGRVEELGTGLLDDQAIGLSAADKAGHAVPEVAVAVAGTQNVEKIPVPLLAAKGQADRPVMP